mgnify:CR=1 FL=1
MRNNIFISTGGFKAPAYKSIKKLAYSGIKNIEFKLVSFLFKSLIKVPYFKSTINQYIFNLVHYFSSIDSFY